MQTARSTKLAERLILVACCSIAVYSVGYNVGFTEGEKFQRKECAVVKGEQVISSTADICTYVRAYGLAIYKRRAI